MSRNSFDPNELQWSEILSRLIGEKRYERQTVVQPRMSFPVPEKTYEEKMIEKAVESCLFKSSMAVVLGGALGFGFGIFTASLDPSYTVVADQQKMTVRGVLKVNVSTTAISD